MNGTLIPMTVDEVEDSKIRLSINLCKSELNWRQSQEAGLLLALWSIFWWQMKE